MYKATRLRGVQTQAFSKEKFLGTGSLLIFTQCMSLRVPFTKSSNKIFLCYLKPHQVPEHYKKSSPGRPALWSKATSHGMESYCVDRY